MGSVGKGHVIAGKYRLEEKLGQGGMGAVWSAEHLDLHSRVAVKLIVPDHADDEAMIARFVREARSAAALRSTHVVQILDYGVDQGLAYIAMEKLEGESLSDRLKREGRLTPALTASVLTHVARAMTRAHELDLMHRDLKPENIFLVKNDDEIVAKVLDFGIVKAPPGALASTGAVTDSGVLLGSPFYMSPEQAHGRADVDHRSDLWAMAVIAYECLTGERPFSGTALGEVMLQICVEPIRAPSTVADVPDGFDAWFLRAADRDPAKRFQSARELAAALREVLGKGSEASRAQPDSDASDLPAPLPTGGEAAISSGATGKSAVAVAGREATFASTTGAISQDGPRLAIDTLPRRRRVPLWAVLAGIFASLVLGALLLRGSKRPSETVPLTEVSEAASPHPEPSTPALPAATTPVAPAVAPAASSAGLAAAPAPSETARPRVDVTPSLGLHHAVSAPATAHAAIVKSPSSPATSASARTSNPLDIRF